MASTPSVDGGEKEKDWRATAVHALLLYCNLATASMGRFGLRNGGSAGTMTRDRRDDIWVEFDGVLALRRPTAVRNDWTNHRDGR